MIESIKKGCKFVASKIKKGAKVTAAAVVAGAGAVVTTVASSSVAQAAWSTAIDFTSLMTDLLAVGGLIMGVVLLVYGFRQVKGMLGR